MAIFLQTTFSAIDAQRHVTGTYQKLIFDCFVTKMLVDP
jgi:hypothetical protein